MCNTNEDPIQPSQQNQTVIVHQSSSNGIGTAGFIMSVLGLVFSWVPIVNFILWILGLLFSFIGLFRSPKGLAVTGFILSFIDIIIGVILLSSLAGILNSIVS